MGWGYPNFDMAIKGLREVLLRDGVDVQVDRWQGVPTEGHFREHLNASFSAPIPLTIKELADDVNPNLPWAEQHFQERVAGDPTNPGIQYKNWPFWTEEAEESMRRVGGKFSHTYMERFWPKAANWGPWQGGSKKEAQASGGGKVTPLPLKGIRYTYGDLNDLVNLLLNDPHTRQAYLPVWFPEDTGAVHGERVPCTLGYHFMLRNGKLHCWYFIRSCDLVHYLRDDIYMAARLCQWILDELQEKGQRVANENQGPSSLWENVRPGALHMTICSLHVFKADFHVLSNS